MFQFALASVLALVLCGQSTEAPTHVLVKIQPSEVTVLVRESVQFSATVIGAYPGVRWIVVEKNGGIIDSNGFYTAPRRIGVFHVIATSEADPRARASGRITVAIEADTHIRPLR
jgi:chitinase